MISFMKKIKQSTEQKIDIKALQDVSPDVLIQGRIKAVLLCFHTVVQCRALRQHETTIVSHIDDYFK